jgi:raffinose/stachyose/melibiose transport system substrate-binding protein
MYLTGSVNFDVPANLEAARGLQGWVEKGYLTDGFEGIGYDDSWQLFSAGEGAMMLTGSWMSADLLAGPNGENIGFFPIPPKTEDGFKLSVGGTGYGFAIRSTSSQPELAAEYINYLYSEETARQMLDAGFFPVYPLDTSGLDDGLVKDIAQAWVSLNETDSIGYYMDWVTPTMYDTITASLQELMAGQITPEQFVTQVNDDYVKFLKEKGVN